MPSIERLTITLPVEMAAALKATVAEGHYASTSDVIREAVRDWTRARDIERNALEALREAIEIGDLSGESVPAAQVYAEVRQLITGRAAENV